MSCIPGACPLSCYTIHIYMAQLIITSERHAAFQPIKCMPQAPDTMPGTEGNMSVQDKWPDTQQAITTTTIKCNSAHAPAHSNRPVSASHRRRQTLLSFWVDASWDIVRFMT